ncbi:hypothetical protein ACLOJK_029449, partial [Asimina triloba]
MHLSLVGRTDEGDEHCCLLIWKTKPYFQIRDEKMKCCCPSDLLSISEFGEGDGDASNLKKMLPSCHCHWSDDGDSAGKTVDVLVNNVDVFLHRKRPSLKFQMNSNCVPQTSSFLGKFVD